MIKEEKLVVWLDKLSFEDYFTNTNVLSLQTDPSWRLAPDTNVKKKSPGWHSRVMQTNSTKNEIAQEVN